MAKRDTLAQIWEPSFRKSNNQGECIKCQQDGKWSVHGLFKCKRKVNDEIRSNPEQITYCRFGEYDDHRQGELTELWYNLKLEDDVLQKNECEKHGPCFLTANRGKTESDSLYTVAKLAEDYDIKKYLDDKNIKPDDNKTYTLQQIHNAIRVGSGVNPYLIFDYTDTHIYLKEVHLCFDLNFNLVDASDVYPAIEHRDNNGFKFNYYCRDDYPYFHTVPAISYPMGHGNQLQEHNISRALENVIGTSSRNRNNKESTRKRPRCRNSSMTRSRSLSRKRMRRYSRNLSAN